MAGRGVEVGHKCRRGKGRRSLKKKMMREMRNQKKQKRQRRTTPVMQMGMRVAVMAAGQRAAQVQGLASLASTAPAMMTPAAARRAPTVRGPRAGQVVGQAPVKQMS